MKSEVQVNQHKKIHNEALQKKNVGLSVSQSNPVC